MPCVQPRILFGTISQGLSCCLEGWFCPGISRHKSVPISPCSPLLGSATDTDTLVLATKVVLCLAILSEILPRIAVKVKCPMSLLDRLPFAFGTSIRLFIGNQISTMCSLILRLCQRLPLKSLCERLPFVFGAN